jgi:hypothetical protein
MSRSSRSPARADTGWCTCRGPGTAPEGNARVASNDGMAGAPDATRGFVPPQPHKRLKLTDIAESMRRLSNLPRVLNRLLDQVT